MLETTRVSSGQTKNLLQDLSEDNSTVWQQLDMDQNKSRMAFKAAARIKLTEKIDP